MSFFDGDLPSIDATRDVGQFSREFIDRLNHVMENCAKTEQYGNVLEVTDEDGVVLMTCTVNQDSYQFNFGGEEVYDVPNTCSDGDDGDFADIAGMSQRLPIGIVND